MSASVRYNVTNGSGNDYDIVEMTGSWSEGTATWDNSNTLFGSTSLGTLTGRGNSVTGSEAVALNSTGVALVQDWVDGSKTNNGFGFTDLADASTDGKEFSDSEVAAVEDRPMLRVVYDTTVAGGSPRHTLSLLGVGI